MSAGRSTAYVEILRHHLRPAMGCTEPIAIAYAAAVARQALGCLPERVEILVSGNILKNAKAVTVPNTGGEKGVEAACAAGIVAGNPRRKLEALAEVTPRQREEIHRFLQQGRIAVGIKPDARLFDILVTLEGGGNHVVTRIADRHTHLAEVRRNGKILHQASLTQGEEESARREAQLTIQGIYAFAKTCDLEEVREILAPQVEYNWRVACEGITGRWGASVGRILLDASGSEDPHVLAKAYAAAGSDARMSGCEMPVIINSGSGNQGITVSVPLIAYARAAHASEAQLYRALVMSNLAAIRIKSLMGPLSAYCGAVSAGCAAGAGIAFLCGGDLELINHTIVNGLAILSGTICDGAKPSCAAKIACAVDAGLTGYQMALQGKEFVDGEGIVKKGVERTIENIVRLGRDGMIETDREILRMMLED